MKKTEVWGYRDHQWEKTEYGIVGKSTAIGMLKKEIPTQGITWSEHCGEEI